MMRRCFFVLTTVLLFSACASKSKVQNQIESHLRDLRNGRTPSPEKLDQLCRKGASAACALGGEPVGMARVVAMLQGPTTAHHTHLTILVPNQQEILYLIMLAGRRPEDAPVIHQVVRAAAGRSREFSAWRIDHVPVTDLRLGQLYEVWVVGPDGQLWDRRSFRSLDLQKTDVRWIAVSGMDDGYRQEQEAAWEKIRARNPEVLFFVGDTVFTEKYLGLEAKEATPSVLWTRYVETRNLLNVFRWSHLVPIFATWDDHDFGKDDGDLSYKFKGEAKEVFQTFFPTPAKDEAWEQGPGVSGRWLAFGSQFIFFDNRSFRTANRENGNDSTHFGLEQTKWAFEQLEKAKTPTWLVSGDQFFGGYHSFESFEGNHPRDFATFMERLRRLKSPVLFLSGDRFLIEAMKISKKDVGQNTYEFTTSGVHARTFAQNLELNPNPRRAVGRAGPHNFLEVDSRQTPRGLKLKVRGWGVSEGLLFERELDLPAP